VARRNWSEPWDFFDALFDNIRGRANSVRSQSGLLATPDSLNSRAYQCESLEIVLELYIPLLPSEICQQTGFLIWQFTELPDAQLSISSGSAKTRVVPFLSVPLLDLIPGLLELV
jgi:hypothetical protein